MKKRATLIISGNQRDWIVETSLHKSDIDEMQSDGVEIAENIFWVPEWIRALRLSRIWWFLHRSKLERLMK